MRLPRLLHRRTRIWRAPLATSAAGSPTCAPSFTALAPHHHRCRRPRHAPQSRARTPASSAVIVCAMMTACTAPMVRTVTTADLATTHRSLHRHLQHHRPRSHRRHHLHHRHQARHPHQRHPVVTIRAAMPMTVIAMMAGLARSSAIAILEPTAQTVATEGQRHPRHLTRHSHHRHHLRRRLVSFSIAACLVHRRTPSLISPGTGAELARRRPPHAAITASS